MKIYHSNDLRSWSNGPVKSDVSLPIIYYWQDEESIWQDEKSVYIDRHQNSKRGWQTLLALLDREEIKYHELVGAIIIEPTDFEKIKNSNVVVFKRRRWYQRKFGNSRYGGCHD